MKRETYYVTEDGKKFTTENDALEYERNELLREKLTKLVAEKLGKNEASLIVDFLLENRTRLVNLLDGNLDLTDDLKRVMDEYEPWHSKKLVNAFFPTHNKGFVTYTDSSGNKFKLL